MTDKFDEIETPRKLGPRETQVVEGWNDIRRLAEQGLPVEHQIDELDDAIVVFKKNFNRADAVAADDIMMAILEHNSSQTSYQARLRHYRGIADYARKIADTSRDAANRFNDFVVKMLVYSNGAVVLGALAFLSSDSASPEKLLNAIPTVLLSSAAGFALGLLSAYLLVHINHNEANHYMSGAWDGLPHKTIANVFEPRHHDAPKVPFGKYDIQPKHIRHWLFMQSAPLAGWLSAACLVFGGAIVFLNLP